MADTGPLDEATDVVTGAERRGFGAAPPGYRPDTSSEPAVLFDRDAELARQEHAATVARLRTLMPIAIVLWLGFIVVDAVVATWVAPGSLLDYVHVRLVAAIPLAISTWLLWRNPSPRQVEWIDFANMASTSLGLTVLCLLSGGIDSPFASYLPLVLIGRAAVLPHHWKQGMVRLGLPALVYPLAMGAGALLSPDLAAEFGDPKAVGTFVLYSMLLGGAWLLLVIGGHNAWTLRRQIFESRSIGRYKLERRLGRGGMGEVWLAQDAQLSRRVALKILHPQRGADPIAILRFEREIMATAALSHPNTIRIYDHGVTEDGLWYYGMEYLDGCSLADLVRDHGPVEPARAIYLIRQATRALAEAHRRGIVHRDLKPDNIFVTSLGGEPDFVKLIDFGIAQTHDERLDVKLTETGSLAGTPTYLSPEVAAGGAARVESDIYGLGSTLYFALTSSPPFVGNALQVVYSHLNEQPDPPSARLGSPVPEDLERVVLKCLSKRPDDRYRSAEELLDALDGCASARQWRPSLRTL